MQKPRLLLQLNPCDGIVHAPLAELMMLLIPDHGNAHIAGVETAMRSG
jgi:hypothetical protein